MRTSGRKGRGATAPIGRAGRASRGEATEALLATRASPLSHGRALVSAVACLACLPGGRHRRCTQRDVPEPCGGAERASVRRLSKVLKLPRRLATLLKSMT